jgi:endonuclease/exonuclease/phosphatase family metal-dependent hydrolase
MAVVIKIPKQDVYLTYRGLKQRVYLTSGNPNYTNQVWTLHKTKNGKTLIIPESAPNQCLDIYDIDYPGPVTWPCSPSSNKGGRNREWVVENKTIRAPNGRYLSFDSINDKLSYQDEPYTWSIIKVNFVDEPSKSTKSSQSSSSSNLSSSSNSSNSSTLKDSGGKSKQFTLSVGTRNILAYNDNKQDWVNALNELRNLNLDVVGLQEVNRVAYKLLDGWRDDYIVTEPYFTVQSHTTVLMVHKRLNPTFLPMLMLPNSPSRGRHAQLAQFITPWGVIGIATAHIESVFFSEAATRVKCSQITSITNHLVESGVDGFIFMGDCNLTQGPELTHENACIAKNQLIDLWKELRGTSDDYNDPKYRTEDVTWDYTGNRKIAHQEWHRPDRIFYRNLTNHTLQPKSIERIVNEYSDHYGLYAVFD